MASLQQQARKKNLCEITVETVPIKAFWSAHCFEAPMCKVWLQVLIAVFSELATNVPISSVHVSLFPA